MNTTKKINVNFSSLVGLKAELLRKQTEIKDAKAKEDSQPKVHKPKVKSKKVKDKKPKIEPGYTEIEDVELLRKSRLMLEAKTILYNKLKKSGGDGTNNYLVDFANKSDESEDEFFKEEDYEDVNSDPEDDWVEYKDCFGRTRKCLRRDLPKMKEKDNMVKQEITKEPAQEERTERIPEPPVIIPEKEPEIEIMRKKWEEQMEKLADKSDIHYQDVLFDEARAHGVGYYAFSQNEDERMKQQENLAKLRKETEQRQKEMQEVKDMKSKMELNRLRAATIRQRVRAGLPAELTDEEEAALKAQINLRNSNESQSTEEVTKSVDTTESDSKAEKQDSRIDNSLIVIEDKIKAFGELLGKRPKWHEMSQEEWVYKRRKDRLGEFAPVYENFRRSGYLKPNRDNKIISRDEDDEDPLKLNTSGPEPTDKWESAGPVHKEEDVVEVQETPVKVDDSLIKKTEPETIEVSEGNDDSDEIGPVPPTASTISGPPTFINTFVPQPISTGPSLPVSFVRSVPPPSVINFSVPPPSIPRPVSLSPIITSPKTSRPIVEVTDSSDSEDSVIIGPVPPPSMDEFSSAPPQQYGPSLIDNHHINMISDIPLPTIVHFSPMKNYPTNVPLLSETETAEELASSSENSTNLDINKISAGLKYLREKFEKTNDS